MKDFALDLTIVAASIDQLAGTPKPEKARIEYSEEGVCPYCSKQMVRSFAAGQPVHLCKDDRYVAPMSLPVLAKVEAEMASHGQLPTLPDLQF